jgi:hypothetical protein
MLAIALLTGALSLANFFLWTRGTIAGGMLQTVSIFGQLILLALTVFAVVRFQGTRRKKLYPMAPYKVFTIPFAVILVSLLGNLCILIVLVLKTMGIISIL